MRRKPGYNEKLYETYNAIGGMDIISTIRLGSLRFAEHIVRSVDIHMSKRVLNSKPEYTVDQEGQHCNRCYENWSNKLEEGYAAKRWNEKVARARTQPGFLRYYRIVTII